MTNRPHLSKFKATGGKIINFYFHGESDYSIPIPTAMHPLCDTGSWVR